MRGTALTRGVSIITNLRKYSSFKPGKTWVKNQSKQIKHKINYQDTIGKAYANQLNKDYNKNYNFVTSSTYNELMNEEDDKYFTQKALDHAYKN